MLKKAYIVNTKLLGVLLEGNKKLKFSKLEKHILRLIWEQGYLTSSIYDLAGILSQHSNNIYTALSKLKSNDFIEEENGELLCHKIR